MKKFLEQFLTSEQVAMIMDAYKVKNPKAEGLPEYISKARLDEEISKRKTSETNYNTVKANLDAIPTDWQEQLNAKDVEISNLKTAHTTELERIKKDSQIDLAIYQAKGKNIKAIKALIDPTQDIAEEITKIKTSDPYLFGSTRGKGTDRTEGTDENGQDEGLTQAQMFAAVGIK